MNNIEVENIYEMIDIYYKCFNLNQINEREADFIFNLIDDKNIKENKILDMGCGTGCVTIPITMKAKEVSGIDKSKEAISLSKKRKEIFNIKNIELIEGNWVLLSKYFSPKEFDIILNWGNSLIYTSSWGMDHVNPYIAHKQIEETINQIYLILKNSGYFILQTLSDREFNHKKIKSKHIFIKNQKYNHLLDWKINYDKNNKIRTNIARRKVYSKENVLLKIYETKFVGYAISSAAFKIMIENVGFSNVSIKKDDRTNYDIIIARK